LASECTRPAPGGTGLSSEAPPVSMPRCPRQPAPLPRRNSFRATRKDPRAICNVSNHGKSISAAITREYIVPPYSSALVVFHSRNSTRRHKSDRVSTHEEQVGWRFPRTTSQHLLIVPLQLFRPKLVACLPVQETSIARRGPRGPTEAYVSRYVAGSAPG